MNIKPNKIAVVNWVFCQRFIVKPFWKYTNIQVLMALKARKDFMVFKQRDTDCEVVYCGWLFACSKLCLPLQRKTRSLCRCFVISGFSRKTNFPYKWKLIYGQKRKANIFENYTCQQVNYRQRTLEINNAHLDRSRCWQHLQEATTKTFSFTVSWQKQINLYFSTQNWVVISVLGVFF